MCSFPRVFECPASAIISALSATTTRRQPSPFLGSSLLQINAASTSGYPVGLSDPITRDACTSLDDRLSLSPGHLRVQIQHGRSTSHLISDARAAESVRLLELLVHLLILHCESNLSVKPSRHHLSEVKRSWGKARRDIIHRTPRRRQLQTSPSPSPTKAILSANPISREKANRSLTI